MREVAVISFAQAPNLRRLTGHNEVEMLSPVTREAVERSGIPKDEIGFTCSGSSDSTLTGTSTALRTFM